MDDEHLRGGEPGRDDSGGAEPAEAASLERHRRRVRRRRSARRAEVREEYERSQRAGPAGRLDLGILQSILSLRKPKGFDWSAAQLGLLAVIVVCAGFVLYMLVGALIALF